MNVNENQFNVSATESDSHSDRLEEVLHRHKAFWGRKRLNRALVGFSRYSYFPLEDFDIGVEDGILSPQMIDPEMLVPQYEQKFKNGGLYMGDLLWAANPIWGLPWLEAIIGCNIQVRKEDKSFWASSMYNDISEVPNLKMSQKNLWFTKLLECMKVLAENSGGRYPLATPLMRGPVDLMAALVGPEKLALAAYDIPSKVRKLAYQCAEIYIEVAEEQLKIMPPFHGGYSQHQHVWAPGSTIMTQQDAALFFTPRNYRELILPADLLILERFEYSIIHLHSTILHTLNNLLNIDALKCIQVVVDPIGPSLKELLPVFAGIQEEKSLIIFGDFNTEQLDFILNSLPATGLCIYVKHN